MKVSVSLKPKVRKFVRQKVATGEFADPQEVLEEALRQWMNEDVLEDSPEYVDYIRSAIAEGDEAISKGDVAPFDGKAILAKAHREHRERGHGKRSSIRSR